MTEKKEPLRIEPASLDLAWNEPRANLRRIEEAVEARLSRSQDAPSESRIFLFPELTLTGFVTRKPAGLSLDPPDPDIEALRRIASEHKTGLAAGFPEANPRDPSRPFNTLALIAPDGKIVCRYRKTHLFTVGGRPESSAYSAGEEGVVCRYRGWKIGFAICFDLRFPALFHEYAKAQADVLLVASCWVGGPRKSEQYRVLGSAYAILTQAYLAAVNRSGRDPYYEYDGSEHVFSPFGERIYRRKACLLDPAVLEDCRRMPVRAADRASYRVRAGQNRPEAL